MAAVKPKMRLRTHTGIDRDTGTVQDGILYNREVFEEDMRFWGNVRFPDDDQELIQLFTDFIDEIGYEGLVRVGTGRTRGMGKVAIDMSNEEELQDRFETFTQRLLQLNKLLHDQTETFKLNKLQGTFFFALTLHAPLILCDDLLRYQSTIDTHTLTKLLGCELPGLQRIYQTASMRRVTGWQEMWGMPRMNEYAIDTGSVFLFSFTCPSTPDETVLKALFELEKRGAGKRRVEGFGRVCISDQFHQEIEPR
jgi:CRISPR-associated Csx10 family RAMP protein